MVSGEKKVRETHPTEHRRGAGATNSLALNLEPGTLNFSEAAVGLICFDY
jgi:hypothetical protein